MSRYIDAEALTAEFKRLTLGENNLIERIFADGVYAVIDTFPTADVVEVRHGYWEEWERLTTSKRDRKIHSILLNCSLCHAPNGRRKDNYCRYCGAKMDGERVEK